MSKGVYFLVPLNHLPIRPIYFYLVTKPISKQNANGFYKQTLFGTYNKIPYSVYFKYRTAAADVLSIHTHTKQNIVIKMLVGSR